MLGVLVWLVVILLICFSVLGWHWAIIEEEFYKLKYCSTVVYMVPRA